MSSEQILVGSGYTDGSMRQIVRTSADILYTIAPTCDSYPDFSANGLTQTIRVHKADQTGIPTTFTRKDSTNEPAAIVSCAAAIDSTNKIHITWAARSAINKTEHLRYAIFDTATDTWGNVTTILSTLDHDDLGQGDEEVAIAIDNSDKPHIVYLGTNNSGAIADRRIYYTNNTSGSWSTAVQVDADITYDVNYKAWHPSICFDTTGRIIVAWVNGQLNATATGTVYVRVRETNGTWNSSISILGSIETGIDQCVGILVTADNRYHLGFSGAKTGGWQPIHYYYSDNNGSSWSANNPSVSQTHNVTIGPNGKGGIRLWHHGNGSPVNVYYVEGVGGSAAWGSQTLFSSGAFDCSVNARWSQYHHSFHATIDIAYWLETYPNDLYVGIEQTCDAETVGETTPSSSSASTTTAGVTTTTTTTVKVTTTVCVDRI